MMNGVWGRKIGMTQVFSDSYKVIPVTVIDTAHWYITNVKTKDRDGYDAVQVGRIRHTYTDKEFAPEWLKAPKKYFSVLKEVDISGQGQEFSIGHVADMGALLAKGDSVDVVGITIGRGFQGGVKRHGFRGGRASHGDKLGRGPGSLSFMRSRGRVVKGHKMAGHMGTEQRVMRNLEVIKVEPDAQIVLVKGSVPGKAGSLVFVRKRRQVKQNG
jgi:large subunit ribosomal protein L3